MKRDLVYTENKVYLLPDIEIKEIDSNHVYEPLRGYAYTLAVFKNDNPIGWIKIETLGFESVNDWIEENKS